MVAKRSPVLSAPPASDVKLNKGLTHHPIRQGKTQKSARRSRRFSAKDDVLETL
jgi:hypothetical protein